MYGNGILYTPPSVSEVVTLGADYTFTNTSIVALWVGTGGTVVAQLRGDATARTWVGVPAGTYLHGNFSIVRSTGNGTTASNIIGVSGVRDAKAGA